MRRFVFGFVLGIIFLQVQPVSPPWAAGGAGLIVLLPFWHRRTVLAQLLTLTAAIGLGFAWAAWRADVRLADELPAIWEGRDIEIVGVIAALPQTFASGERFEFVVESVSTAGARVPQRIMLSWYRGRQQDEDFELPALQAGERWQLTVRLRKPHGNANPHAFDYESWLLERNLRATGYVRPAGGQRLNAMVWQAGFAIERWRQKIRDEMLNRLPETMYPWRGILVALAIGDQQAIDGSEWTTFNRAGIGHVLSVSGIHITMVASVFGLLAGGAWRRVPQGPLHVPAQHVRVLVGAGVALIYTLLAGFAVPAQRTLYMLLVAAWAMLSGRLVAPSRILALALLIVVLIDPWAVLSAGFWLSFGAVAALILVSAARVGEVTGWRGKMRAWGMTQWAATLASLPILLLVFQQFSLVSPLANAFTIPVISLFVTPLAILGALIPGGPILHLAHWPLPYLMDALVWCAAWPVWQSPAPPLWAILVAGSGVGLALLPRGLPGRWAGVFLMLPAIFWPVSPPAEGEASFVLLDVGQGLASMIRTRSHVLIYDPGPLYSAESDAGQRIVVPYLRAMGINRIDRLVVTHRDSDHAGGLASVRSALPVGDLRSSMPGIGAQPCLAGERWVWDGVEFEFLYPFGPDLAVDRKSNHLSCVLRVTAGGRRLMLTSDIEAPDERAMLGRYPENLAADVLLVPHHGSRTSSTPAFLDAVGASDVLVPVGYRNRFGHPKADVLERYVAQGSRIWRTDLDGAIAVDLSRSAVRISRWRAEHARYWHGR